MPPITAAIQQRLRQHLTAMACSTRAPQSRTPATCAPRIGTLALYPIGNRSKPMRQPMDTAGAEAAALKSTSGLEHHEEWIQTLSDSTRLQEATTTTPPIPTGVNLPIP